MSGANYEYCPGCESKAFYVGEDDVPGGVEIWHKDCREQATTDAVAEALRLERELIAKVLGRVRLDPSVTWNGYQSEGAYAVKTRMLAKLAELSGRPGISNGRAGRRVSR